MSPLTPRTHTPARAPYVITLLTPSERATISAAATDTFTPIHRESVQQAWTDIRHGDVYGVIISLAGFNPAERDLLSALADRYPAMPMIGVVHEPTPESYQRAAQLGAAGVRRVVDATTDHARAMRVLRSTFAPDPDQQYAITARETILADLTAAGVPSTHGMRPFFTTLFSDTQPLSVKQLAADAGILPTTLISRFRRSGSPHVKSYIVGAWLVRFAKLAENRMLSLAAIADVLGASSPQSMNRFIKHHSGLTGLEFRDTRSAVMEFEHFRGRFVRPYLTRWAAGDDPMSPFMGRHNHTTKLRSRTPRYAAAS